MHNTAMGRIAGLLAAAAIVTLTPGVTGQTQNAGNPTEVEGTLEVRYEDYTGRARLRHFVHTPTRRLELQFSGAAPDIPTGSRVRARGNLSNNTLMISSSGTNVQTMSLAASNTFGVQQTLVMLINFQDNVAQPYTVASAQNVTFTQTNGYYLENTYQQTSLAGIVVGWYTLPATSTSCDTDTWASLADQAATSNGINVAAYPRRIYAFPQTSACGWWGLGTVGGDPSRAWVNGNYSLRVVAHELGHNFGDYHSHSMSCDTTGCTTSEYGDDHDTMGGTTGHMNAFQKERLGWLNYGASPPIETVSTTNNYWIEAIETAGNGGPKALKVLQSSDRNGRTWYYIEARTQVGVDSSLVPGVIVHSAYDGNGNSSYEKDVQPSTTTWDSILDAGDSFIDSALGLTITTLSADNTGAFVQVAFDSSPACTQANPSIGIVVPSGSVAPGAAASFAVTVTNNDTSACSASTFGLGYSVSSGWSGSYSAGSVSLAPGASASVTLQVMAPAGTSDGTYAVGASATNSSAATYTASASANEMIYTAPAASVTVRTNQPTYSANQKASISVAVTSGSASVNGAAVAIAITKANGTVVRQSGITASNGLAVFTYRVSRNDPKGGWTVVASSGAATANTSFVVQ